MILQNRFDISISGYKRKQIKNYEPIIGMEI